MISKTVLLAPAAECGGEEGVRRARLMHPELYRQTVGSVSAPLTTGALPNFR